MALTSWRYSDVNSTFYKRHVPAGMHLQRQNLCQSVFVSILERGCILLVVIPFQKWTNMQKTNRKAQSRPTAFLRHQKMKRWRSGHMTFIQRRRINVDATSWRCIDVNATLYKCQDMASTLMRRCTKRHDIASTLMRGCKSSCARWGDTGNDMTQPPTY